jgi:hypothetical protein
MITFNHRYTQGGAGGERGAPQCLDPESAYPETYSNGILRNTFSRNWSKTKKLKFFFYSIKCYYAIITLKLLDLESVYPETYSNGIFRNTFFCN